MKLLTEHLNDWQQNLEASEKTLKHARQSRARVEKIAPACGFRTIADIDAAKINMYLKKMRKHGELVTLKQKDDDGEPIQKTRMISKRTSNHYTTVIKAFTKWLVEAFRAETDPLASLKRIPVLENDLTKKRRALTDDECAMLLDHTAKSEPSYGLSGEERAFVYEFAL